jgi:hypothetical protein
MRAGILSALNEPSMQGTTPRCRVCRRTIDQSPLHLGRLPACNRFTRTGAVEPDIDLNIVECEACGLVQLRDSPAIDVIVPRLPWIRYKEPENHLDGLVDELLALRPKAHSVLGTGPFEQPLLSRFAARGLTTQGLALETTSMDERYPYLESWQASLNVSHLTAAAAQFGTFDIVSCRYIVEHSSDPIAALSALKRLLSPNGLLLLEIPDSSKFLAARDYCFLWEEHSCYFVETTLKRLAELAGFRVLALLRYPGALEDALVIVLEETCIPVPTYPSVGASSLFHVYRDTFAPTRAALQNRLAHMAGPERDRVALFGIGHHAIMFVNAFGLASHIALAVDDDADKAGFFPPGFRVPVVSSERLRADERIKLCLFAVAPHIQAKVRDKLAPLAARGVEFRSIYAALDDSIVKDLAL